MNFASARQTTEKAVTKWNNSYAVVLYDWLGCLGETSAVMMVRQNRPPAAREFLPGERTPKKGVFTGVSRVALGEEGLGII